MRKLLGLIKAAVGVTVFLLLLGFAVKNSDNVAMRYFLGLEWHAPLVLMLLVFFTAGAALGIAASLSIMVRQRREIVGLKREIRGLTRATGLPGMAESL
ncbi:MAG: LapA family protein [Betaproteobacteria bacterium]